MNLMWGYILIHDIYGKMITNLIGLAYLGRGMCLWAEEGGSSREVYGEVASRRSSIDEGGRFCV